MRSVDIFIVLLVNDLNRPSNPWNFALFSPEGRQRVSSIFKIVRRDQPCVKTIQKRTASEALLRSQPSLSNSYYGLSDLPGFAR